LKKNLSIHIGEIYRFSLKFEIDPVVEQKMVYEINGSAITPFGFVVQSIPQIEIGLHYRANIIF